MKILMLTDVLYPDTVGGAGRVVYHVSDELSKRDHEVHIVTRNPADRLPHVERLKPNLFVHRFLIPSGKSLGLVFSEIKNSAVLIGKLSRRIPFDLVCVHQSLAGLGPFLSGHLKGIPSVYYFQSPWHEEYLIKKQEDLQRSGRGIRLTALVMKFIEKRVMFKASRVIVLSEYMRNKVIKFHRYPAERIIKIPGGVDLERFSLPPGGKAAAKKSVQWPLDKTVFLTIRNLVPRMGLENLIEAFNRSEILRQRGYLLIGGEGPLKERLLSMVQDYNLMPCLRLLGHIPEQDLPGLYQAADFFVLPTRHLEGFGLVILEALASGTPVLGTPVGAIPEVIGPFKESLLFKSAQWQDMMEKMGDVVQRPEKYDIPPKACRSFAEENFSWQRMSVAFEREALSIIQKEKR